MHLYIHSLTLIYACIHVCTPTSMNVSTQINMQICTHILTTWNGTNLLSTFTSRPRNILAFQNSKWNMKIPILPILPSHAPKRLFATCSIYCTCILVSFYGVTMFCLKPGIIGSPQEFYLTFQCLCIYTSMIIDLQVHTYIRMHAHKYVTCIPTTNAHTHKMYSSQPTLQNVEQMSQPRTNFG